VSMEAPTLCLHIESVEPFMKVFVKKTADCIHVCVDKSGPCNGGNTKETTLIELLKELARKYGLANVTVESDEDLGDIRNAGDLMKYVKNMAGGRP